jgi:hypothetical protein
MSNSTYIQLLALFDEWRSFEAPAAVDRPPDYSPAMIGRRLVALREFQERLGAIETSGWTIPQRVDHRLVRAEMNGMQFHLQVLQPFARDPAFYASVRTDESDTPAEEGPTIHGAVRLWQYSIWPRTVLDVPSPLTRDDTARLAAQLDTIPPLLDQARENLSGATARDLWMAGIRAFDRQGQALDALRGRIDQGDLDLVRAVDRAIAATHDFDGWLRAEAPRKVGPSGIGKAHYTWFLRNVLLVPLSWQDEVTILRRELARAHASIRLEENRNHDLPCLEPVATPEAYEALQNAAIPRFLRFVEKQGILAIEPWMELALRERVPPFVPESARNFFDEICHRDPVPWWTHQYHWWDQMRMRVSPHPNPIRRGPPLYNVWMHRSEGLATAMEEWMMHAGLYDLSPRSREIVWIMLGARAARGLGSLYAHANDITMTEAGDIHVGWTPRGFMHRDLLLCKEQHLYLRQPGYGASYVTGARLLDEVMAQRARQLGEDFNLRRFFEELNAVGMIPVSLIYWELTGDDAMVTGGRM